MYVKGMCQVCKGYVSSMQRVCIKYAKGMYHVYKGCFHGCKRYASCA